MSKFIYVVTEYYGEFNSYERAAYLSIEKAMAHINDFFERHDLNEWKRNPYNHGNAMAVITYNDKSTTEYAITLDIVELYED